MFEKLLNLIKKKDKGPIPDFSDVEVKLKPVAGIRPGVYLTVIYGIILLLIIFLVFFLPGIAANGTYITFRTEPVRAGVWIDGIKAGVTPCEILVPAGTREITITRPYFTPTTITREVGNFIFAIPFFPKRETIDVVVTIADSKKLAEYTFQEFSQWSMIDNFGAGEGYYYPPVLQDAMKTIAANPDDKTYRDFKKLLDDVLPMVHNPELAKDYMAASAILESLGKTGSENSLYDFITTHPKLKDSPGQGLFLLYSLLPPLESTEPVSGEKGIPATQKELKALPDFQKQLSSYKSDLDTFRTEQGPISDGSRSYAGVTFRFIPSGSFIMGAQEDPASRLSREYVAEFPHPEKVNSFYMASTEITNKQFQTFLLENPEWQKKNIDTLIKNELVDEYYLLAWNDTDFPAGEGIYPVTYISAYAAEAYCTWLTKQISGSMSGKIARLPIEAEWEWAAAGGNPSRFFENGANLDTAFSKKPKPAGTGGTNQFGLYDMSGNVFEWCADWYAKACGLTKNVVQLTAANENVVIYPTGGAKAVRGGAWVTKSEEISSSTRGSQPPYFCTPYLGFRPVITEK